MEVITQYDTIIEKWDHKDESKFIEGAIAKHPLRYTLGITPPDPNDYSCCYFNVWVEERHFNQTINEIVFHTKTYTCFKVRNNNHVPTLEFYFSLIQQATFVYSQIYYQRIKGTNLQNHKIAKPHLDNSLRDDIQKCIDIWDKTLRNRGMN